jgi:molybdopterin-guanine dinucleotide biosynthesis protein A
MDIGCAITAGGKASRLNGITKALISVEGQSILQRNLDILSPIFKEIIIISNNPLPFEQFDVPIFGDYYQNIGPLAGLHSALKHCKHSATFFCGSDMPFITDTLIRLLIDKSNKSTANAIILRANSHLEPLFGVYSKSILEDLEYFIQQGDNYSMQGFLKTIAVDYIDIESNEANLKALYNINTKEDIQRIAPKDEI